MAAPLLTKVAVLAAAVEATPGTAEALTASNAQFNVFDVSLSLTQQFISREGQGSLSPITGSQGMREGRLTFSLHGFGGASTPAWMSVFLPSCGLGETSGVFAPESKAPESSAAKVKSITAQHYRGPGTGPRGQIHSAMGDMTCRWNAGNPITFAFDFKGVFGTPSDVAILVPTYPTTVPLRAATAALTIGSVTPKIAEFELALNNEVAIREDANQASGLFGALITGRRITVTVLIEAATVATYDPHADMAASTERAIAFTLGSAGNSLAFSMPKCQVTSVLPEDRNGTLMWRIVFSCNRSATGGDDELSITRA